MTHRDSNPLKICIVYNQIIFLGKEGFLHFQRFYNAPPKVRNYCFMVIMQWSLATDNLIIPPSIHDNLQITIAVQQPGKFAQQGTIYTFE